MQKEKWGIKECHCDWVKLNDIMDLISDIWYCDIWSATSIEEAFPLEGSCSWLALIAATTQIVITQQAAFR